MKAWHVHKLIGNRAYLQHSQIRAGATVPARHFTPNLRHSTFGSGNMSSVLRPVLIAE